MSAEEKEVYDMNKKLKAAKEKSLNKNSQGAPGFRESKKAQLSKKSK